MKVRQFPIYAWQQYSQFREDYDIFMPYFDFALGATIGSLLVWVF